MPSPYTRYVEGLACTCVAENPVMLANGALVTESPHESEDAISRTSFVAAKFTPASCRMHPTVRVHCVVPVNGPFIVNAPTKYE
jgi:hypothetical protein